MLACEKDSPQQEKIYQVYARAAPVRVQPAEVVQEGMTRGILPRGRHKKLGIRGKARKPLYPNQDHFPRAGGNQGQRPRVTCDAKWRVLRGMFGVAVVWTLIPNLCCRSIERVKRRRPLYAPVSYRRQQQTFLSHGKW